MKSVLLNFQLIFMVFCLKNQINYDLDPSLHHVDGTKIVGKDDDMFDEYYSKQPPKLKDDDDGEI